MDWLILTVSPSLNMRTRARGNTRYAIKKEQDVFDKEKLHREIYRKLPVIKELEAEIAGRSVACARKLLEGETGVLDKLREDLQDLREQKALIIKAAGYPGRYFRIAGAFHEKTVRNSEELYDRNIFRSDEKGIGSAGHQTK